MNKKSNKVLLIFVLTMISLIVVLRIISTFFLSPKSSNLTTDQSEFLMNTLIDVQVISKDEKLNKKALSYFYESFRHTDKVSSSYTNYEETVNNLNLKNINLINENSQRKVSTFPENIEQVKMGIDIYNASDGRFNILIGSLLDVYRTGDENNKYPEKKEIASALLNSNPRDIILSDSTITIPKDSKIDLGAISKGYGTYLAIENIKNKLQDTEYGNISEIIVNAGGSIYYYSKNNTPFQVKIQNPDDSTKIIHSFSLESGEAVSTSASYYRNYVLNDVTYPHIVNGITGEAKNNYKSVTVVTTNPTISDIASTTLYLASPDQLMEQIKKLETYYNIELKYYIIKNDNEVIKNKI